jgi:quercetin dioxygenase-like cupin family protein
MAVNISIGQISNLFLRQMTFENVGDVEIGHTHPYDHMTLLASGSIRVKTVDGVRDFTAPHMVYISAGKKHELEALTNGSVAYCIHVLRDDDGAIVSEDMIPADPSAVAKIISGLICADPNQQK